jgi:hypothetical protein
MIFKTNVHLVGFYSILPSMMHGTKNMKFAKTHAIGSHQGGDKRNFCFSGSDTLWFGINVPTFQRKLLPP